MESKELYALKLHQPYTVSDYLQVIRVPGGWIYNFKKGGEIFIPFNNEYQKLTDEK
ncbi:MAG: hypothetical protein ACE1ZQ_09645 [Ignavibacteriaceae bacterium]